MTLKMKTIQNGVSFLEVFNMIGLENEDLAIVTYLGDLTISDS